MKMILMLMQMTEVTLVNDALYYDHAAKQYLVIGYNYLALSY